MHLLAALAATALVAAPPAPVFRISVSATETASYPCDSRLPAPGTLTLHASLRSTAPFTATLRGGALGEKEFPMQATVSVDVPGCGFREPTTCGPTTVDIVPGGFFALASGRMRLSYDSNAVVFPESSSSCSSGLMEALITKPVDPRSLLQHTTTTIAGTYSRDAAGAHIDVAYTVRFTRVAP